MRRWILYVVIVGGLLLFGLSPFQSNDVGKLRPVKTAMVSAAEAVTVYSDPGDKGTGGTWTGAVSDLEAKAPGVVFYDTGEYLLLTEGAVKLLPDIIAAETFRSTCGVCLVEGDALPDLEEVGAYLDSHPPRVTLNEIRADLAVGKQTDLPVLRCEEGRMKLEQPENR